MTDAFRADAEAITRLCLAASPTSADAPHLALYRTMVRGRFRDVLVAAAPRFTASIGSDATSIWLASWLANDPPRTRLFWELPLRAEASLVSLRETSTITAAQHDIARFELAQWRVRHTPFRAEAPSSPLRFTAAPRVTHAHVRLDLEHPVVSTQQDGPERLLIFRRANDSVGVRTLNRVGALVFDAIRVESAQTLVERMQRLVRENGLAGGEAFAAALGEMLADWLEDGLLLGSAEETG